MSQEFSTKEGLLLNNPGRPSLFDGGERGMSFHKVFREQLKCRLEECSTDLTAPVVSTAELNDEEETKEAQLSVNVIMIDADQESAPPPPPPVEPVQADEEESEILVEEEEEVPVREQRPPEQLQRRSSEAFNQIEFGTVAEQKDEAFLDDRSDAEDDLVKGRIKFPKDCLYGRDEELASLHAMYKRCVADGSGSQVVFIGGFSGTGKSALVTEFTRQLAAAAAAAERQKAENTSNHKRGGASGGGGGGNDDGRGETFRRYTMQLDDAATTSFAKVSGKFSKIKSANPFSAISQAMQDLVTQLAQSESELTRLRSRLSRRADLKSDYYGCADTRTLVDMIPPLAGLLLKEDTNYSKKDLSSEGGSMSQDLTNFKFLFCKFLKTICTQQRPIILFIDDLQWADALSMELITAICKDSSIKYFVFLGSYRSNEVHEEHPLMELMHTVEQAKKTSGDNNKKCAADDKVDCGCALQHIELTNLSPKHVGQFIADSIGRPDDVDEVATISDVIYSKTLGNIFFVIQALEELVRRNVLFYDMMSFQWEWGNVERVDLEKYLSADVVELVRCKIVGLPDKLQKALTLAAFTNSSIDLLTLQALMKSEGINMDTLTLITLLDKAVEEGVLLTPTHYDLSSSVGSGIHRRASGSRNNQVYTFAHDRIQEAACSLVDPGHDRDALLARLSMVLADRGMNLGDDEGDWMLFVAVHHLNALPDRHVANVKAQLVHLNCHVAKLAANKAAFAKTSELAHAAVRSLDPDTCWKDDQYQSCLELHNLLMETEFSLGNYDQALAAVEQVLQYARSPQDKAIAYHTRITTICEQNEKNYVVGVENCIEALKLYEVDLPVAPTKREMLLERLRLRLALGNRPLLVLTKLPISKDDSIMRLLQLTSQYANFTKNHNVVKFIAIRAMRVALQQGCITKYLPWMVTSLGLPLRKKEKYRESYGYASIAATLLDRFPDEKGKGALTKVMVFLTSATLLLRRTFADCVGDLMGFHKILIANGIPDLGFAAAMLSSYCFFAAGLPLNSMLEPKLQLFEDLSVDMGQKGFIVLFKAMRQFLYNLQGRSRGRPTLLKGIAFDEETTLADMEGNALKMMSRDVGIFRLQLAYIFDDEEIMEEMLERLEQYPIFDMPIVRQYLRLAYVGFAGLTLGKRTAEGPDDKAKNHKYLNMGLEVMKYFRKLDKFGSPNSHSIYFCLRAIHQPTKANFEAAINICTEAPLMNLAAIMNERYAYFMEKHFSDVESKEEYLSTALWLYNDWGAKGKVNQLREDHEFLRGATRSMPPSMLSSLMRNTNMKGFAPAVDASTSSGASKHRRVPSLDGSLHSRRYAPAVDSSIISTDSLNF